MNKQNFNRDWLLIKGEATKTVTLPHDAMTEENRFADCPTGSAGGYYPGGVYKYQKTFEKPSSPCAMLEFEGVYGECRVYLNGKKLAENHYGYHNFYVDISGSKECDNLLEVEVDNSRVVNSRWYSGSGIYRPVWLYTGGDVRIAPDGVQITVSDIEEALAKAEIMVEFQADTLLKTGIRVTIEDDAGHCVHSTLTPYTVLDHGPQQGRAVVYLRNPRLWDTESPNLYTCRVALEQDDKVLDEWKTTFGIRKVQADPVNGFRLNGKALLLRGACIHHDNGVIGAVEHPDAAYRRISLLKEAGFNAVRISHHPASRAILNACDRLGMLVMDETFDMWQQEKTPCDFSRYFPEEWESIVRHLVKKDYNHPCVFMYCIGNEIPEIVSSEGIRISRNLSRILRSLDSTRLLTNAINGMCAVTGDMLQLVKELGLVTSEQIEAITGNPESSTTELFGILLAGAANGTINDAMTALASNLGRVMEHPSVGQNLQEPLSHVDVAGYNYMKSRYEIDAREYPDMVVLGSETTPPDIDILWDECMKIPQVIGDFVWTGWDYIGEAGVGHTNYEGKSQFSVAYPGYLAYCGDLDITGYRRPQSYLREIAFGLRKAPYVSVQHPKYFACQTKNTNWAEYETMESWSFSGYEGKPVRVMVYADAPQVALYVNGKEAGCKETHRMRAEFEITYEPGKIEAVTADGSHSILTTGADTHLEASISKGTISVDGLTFVEMELRDSNGTLNMDAPLRIKIECDGAVSLLGFGTADPNATDSFCDDTHATFHGRALAVLRGETAGTGTVTITAGNTTITKQITVQ